jgi:hypothetical protein
MRRAASTSLARVTGNCPLAPWASGLSPTRGGDASPSAPPSSPSSSPFGQTRRGNFTTPPRWYKEASVRPSEVRQWKGRERREVGGDARERKQGSLPFSPTSHINNFPSIPLFHH